MGKQEMEKKNPSITFEFDGEDSVGFKYVRSGVTPFQLIIIVETMRTIAEQEIMEWHQESVEITQEDEIIEQL